MIWFTSDTHFGHKNIIKFCNRPFESIREMDQALIENWNSCVAKDDTVYHLGDVAFCSPKRLESIFSKLNGKIYLVLGNHDKAALRAAHLFQGIKDRYEIKVPDDDAPHNQQIIVLSHYAMRVWNKSHWGAWHLYGHSHGTLPDDPTSLSFDVGVDCWDYKPISYTQVKETMASKNWKPPF